MLVRSGAPARCGRWRLWRWAPRLFARWTGYWARVSLCGEGETSAFQAVGVSLLKAPIGSLRGGEIANLASMSRRNCGQVILVEHPEDVAPKRCVPTPDRETPLVPTRPADCVLARARLRPVAVR